MFLHCNVRHKKHFFHPCYSLELYCRTICIIARRGEAKTRPLCFYFATCKTFKRMYCTKDIFWFIGTVYCFVNAKLERFSHAWHVLISDRRPPSAERGRNAAEPRRPRHWLVSATKTSSQSAVIKDLLIRNEFRTMLPPLCTPWSDAARYDRFLITLIIEILKFSLKDFSKKFSFLIAAGHP